MVGVDRRPAADYARRGGFYGVTAHDFHHPDGGYGFRQWEYEALQHVPLLRETWVLSFHAQATTTATKDDQADPVLHAAVDRRRLVAARLFELALSRPQQLLLQAEWRVIVNQFFDTAVFYDAGKVTAHARDLNLDDLRHDVGFGVAVSRSGGDAGADRPRRGQRRIPHGLRGAGLVLRGA